MIYLLYINRLIRVSILFDHIDVQIPKPTNEQIKMAEIMSISTIDVQIIDVIKSIILNNNDTEITICLMDELNEYELKELNKFNKKCDDNEVIIYKNHHKEVGFTIPKSLFKSIYSKILMINGLNEMNFNDMLKSNYKYSVRMLSDKINIINEYLLKYKISLRHILYISNGLYMSINKSHLINILNVHIDDTLICSNIIEIVNLCDKDIINIYYDFLNYFEKGNAFCFVIPSYNNRLVYTKNLDSVFGQNYSHFRVVYIDDDSDLNEIDLVHEYINQTNNKNRTILLSQYKRQRQCAGRYIGYHMAFDDEIIVMLDGDDWLYGSSVLTTLNEFYTEHKLMISYGSYYDFFGNKILKLSQYGVAHHDFPSEIISTKGYRKYKFITGHLRTGYAKLFKAIKLKDLLYVDGTFLHLGTDYAEMMPALEMADTRHRNIKLPLCIYNKDNSYQYTTSYGRMNQIECSNYKMYRIEVGKILQNKLPYPTMNYDEIFRSRNCIDKEKTKYSILNNANVQWIDILELFDGDCIYKSVEEDIKESDIYLTAKHVNNIINPYYSKVICRIDYFDKKNIEVIIKNNCINSCEKLLQLIIF